MRREEREEGEQGEEGERRTVVNSVGMVSEAEQMQTSSESVRTRPAM